MKHINPIYPTAKSLKDNDELSDYGEEIYPILDKVIAKSKEWFEETKTDRDTRADEVYTCGFEIDGHYFDISIWDEWAIADEYKWHCGIIECYEDENGYHCRGFRDQFLWEVEMSNEEIKERVRSLQGEDENLEWEELEGV